VTEARTALRSWLQGCEALGEPEIFLPTGGRVRALAAMRGGERSAIGAGVETVPGDIAKAGTREDILGLQDMDRLRSVAEACTRCSLHTTRTKVVFADGSPDARLMCVGEAPGANEDRTGLPFVGRAGQLLDRLLLSVGFPRADVFICNVLKCRPPGNRNPLPAEIETCSPFLVRQVELVQPTVIVAFGTFAAQTLLGIRDSLRNMRGRTHLYRGHPLVVTYHPAALLRNPGWTRLTWLDLQLARRIADGDHAATSRHEPEVKPPDASRATGEDEPRDQLTLGGGDG